MRSSVRTGQIRIVNKPESSGLVPRRLESVQGFLEVSSLGSGGETWVSEGMQRVEAASAETDSEVCPFCEQELSGSGIIVHYKAYFSDSYAELKQTIRATGTNIRDNHGGDIPAAFERSIRTTVQKHEFWKDFTELPEIGIDTAAVSREWTAAREAVLQQLRKKAAAPLETMELTQATLDLIRVYRTRIEEVTRLSDNLIRANVRLDVVKEQAAADDLAALTSDLDKLKAIKARFAPETSPLCDVYLAEKEEKKLLKTYASKRVKNSTHIGIEFFLSMKMLSMNISENSMHHFALAAFNLLITEVVRPHRIVLL